MDATERSPADGPLDAAAATLVARAAALGLPLTAAEAAALVPTWRALETLVGTLAVGVPFGGEPATGFTPHGADDDVAR
jgi:hypothetical protein